MQSVISINPDYLGMLILKVRALMAQEPNVSPNSGSNPSDDAGPAVLQEDAGNLTRSEILQEIEGLDSDRQAELVALMWLGRGDAEPEEWRDLVQMAAERRETPTGRYLLDHALLGDYWAEGLDRLGYGSIVSGVGEL